jgi:hypothetical protein
VSCANKVEEVASILFAKSRVSVTIGIEAGPGDLLKPIAKRNHEKKRTTAAETEENIDIAKSVPQEIDMLSESSKVLWSSRYAISKRNRAVNTTASTSDMATAALFTCIALYKMIPPSTQVRYTRARKTSLA